MLKSLLSVEDLFVHFQWAMAPVGVVRVFTTKIEAPGQASFEIYPGETLALVGESEPGKSTQKLARKSAEKSAATPLNQRFFYA